MMEPTALLRRLSLCLILAACARVGAAGALITPPAFTISSRTADGWLLTYDGSHVNATTLLINGVPHLLFHGGAGAEPTAAGSPALPVEALSLGIPSGCTLTAELLDPVYSTSQNQLVAPVPRYVRDTGGDLSPVFMKDSLVYGGNRLLPDKTVRVGSPFVLRGQTVCGVRLWPVQYNPSTGLVRRLLRATLRVHIVSPAGAHLSRAAAGDAGTDPRYESVFRGLLLNAVEAQQWRQTPSLGKRAAGDSTASWFEKGRVYYRIPVAADGWYQIMPGTLRGAGANLSGIDPASFRMFSRGKEIPLLVRPDTAVEFYALRKYGDTTFYDNYTDTNVYWLTWGGIPGLRFARTAGPDSGGVAVTSVPWVRHMEQNHAMYRGATEQEIIDIGIVPGEAWIWEFYYPLTLITHQFVLDAVDSRTGQGDSLRIRLFGTTESTPPVRSLAKLWLNDSLKTGAGIGQIALAQRTGGVYQFPLPADSLFNGANFLTIESEDTQTSPNQFYLDWFEILYRRYLRAVGDLLAFTVPVPSGHPLAAVTVGGFSSDSIEVFDVAGARQIVGGTVAHDSAGASILFRDTLSAPRTYVVHTRASATPIAAVTAKTFADIRTLPGGADYIVIAHRKFLAQASSLAAYRQRTNGVRTQVIAVQDIYDEFNYGIYSPFPIKAFLRYAYDSWTRPAPAIALLFGGANADFHGWLGNDIKIDYIPTYGNPVSDNWYVCFDTTHTFLPSMIIGRLPVEDTVQAAQLVGKIMGYDASSLGDWNKTFLFMTGGLSPGEEASFDALSASIASQYVTPPPLGGRALRVSKSSTVPIDSSMRSELNAIVTSGIGFINFLGHSAGSIWSLDIGSPSALGNTNGMLPFVASVSCNVSSFADQTTTNLSEQFVLAQNRGAIAMWGSVSLSYAFQGVALTDDFLETMTADSVRAFGALTTTARYKLWLTSGSDYITVGMVNLTPLLGDPLSAWAIPVRPDLAVSPSDLSVTPRQTTVNDSAATLAVRIHNYGLVPADSVGVNIVDFAGGQSTPVLTGRMLPPTLAADSLSVTWRGTRQAGLHTLTVTLDPAGRIAEVTKANNSASIDQQVYGNLMEQVRPLENMVVSPGPQVLCVTNPPGADSLAIQVMFEIDTTAAFSSPFKSGSGALGTGPVAVQWTTPSIPDGRVCWWRVRTSSAGTTGPWQTYTFATSAAAPALPAVRWRENARGLFASGSGVQTVVTDSGVIIGRLTPVTLSVHSVGARANASTGDYSSISADGNTLSGYPWLTGNGFLCGVVDDVTGIPVLRSFDTPSSTTLSDSMAAMIRAARTGNYVCVSVVTNGATNVTAALRTALKSLGSTLIDSLRSGDAWSLIARAGGGAPLPLEHWSRTGTTTDSLAATNYFPSTSGTFAGPLMPMPQRLESFRWSPTVASGATSAVVALLGIRSGGAADTLRRIPSDSTSVGLAGLNQAILDTSYTAFRAEALLATSDTRFSPLLRDWSADVEPPADLAVSARTLSSPKPAVREGGSNTVSATVYNIGYRRSDSARAVLSVRMPDRSLRPIAYAMIDSIGPGGSRLVQIPFQAGGLGAQAALQVRVSPPPGTRDLIAGNNSAFINVAVSGYVPLGGTVHLFADGVQLMEGDYVAARPKILVQLDNLTGVGSVPPEVDLFVDNVPVAGPAASVPAGALRLAGNPTFSPVIANGAHELKVRVTQLDASGTVDSVTQRLVVNVTDQYRILQMFNYPDPFGNDTWFTFVLTGNAPPEELTIRIYTVKGRKIRELKAQPGSLLVGFNRVYWDGRDAEGDEVANGYYLYQVLLTGGGKSLTATGKLARVR